jgi:hypothetical protein
MAPPRPGVSVGSTQCTGGPLAQLSLGQEAHTADLEPGDSYGEFGNNKEAKTQNVANLCKLLVGFENSFSAQGFDPWVWTFKGCRSSSAFWEYQKRSPRSRKHQNVII